MEGTLKADVALENEMAYRTTQQYDELVLFPVLKTNNTLNTDVEEWKTTLSLE
jgi:hypothetical protein